MTNRLLFTRRPCPLPRVERLRAPMQQICD